MKYFGSVRFFKNLILLCVVVLILIPSLFAVKKHAGLKEAEQRVTLMEGELEQMRDRLSDLEQRNEVIGNAPEETEQVTTEREEEPKESFSGVVSSCQGFCRSS